MIYLCWLHSNPGSLIEIRRKFTQQRAKIQPKRHLSDNGEMSAEVKGFGKGATEQRKVRSTQSRLMW